MNADLDPTANVTELEQILSTELGEPSPVAEYHRPLNDEERAEVQAELDSIEPAHAKAAARLLSLFAG